LADAASYTIKGTVDPNAFVRVVLDSNKDQFPDPNEPVVGSQQLTNGATAYAISVPLTQNTDNFFHVYAWDGVRQSAASYSVQIKENATPPVISNVAASPNTFTPNGDGRRDDTLISFAVNQPSRVSISVYNTAGHVVASPLTDPHLVRTAGYVNYARWDGRSSVGEIVPTGTYTFRVTAVDTIGRSTTSAPVTVKVSR
jgi:hypothetical protein